MIIVRGQIYLARGNIYHADLKNWELRHPSWGHFLSTTNLVHASAACAGKYAEVLRWPVLDVLWEHGQQQGKQGRNIGWCAKCCVDRVAKAEAA